LRILIKSTIENLKSKIPLPSLQTGCFSASWRIAPLLPPPLQSGCFSASWRIAPLLPIA